MERGEYIPTAGGKKRSPSSPMERGENIPTDLMIEIFSRLPAKSIARFRSLSKLWASILRGPDFTDLFLTRSSARPRLLFAMKRYSEWLFFSCPQNPYEKSVTADYHTKFSSDVSLFISSHAYGLVYFSDMYLSEKATVVFNPITGMYVSLPDVFRYSKCRGFLGRGFLGFDPIDNRFKVLTETYPFFSQRVHLDVLTLRNGDLSWRNDFVSCPEYDRSFSEGICINGVLYYLALTGRPLSSVIVCFDIRSEEFKVIDAECFNDQRNDTNGLVLINYKGKLGGIRWKNGQAFIKRKKRYGQAGGRRTIELCMLILVDAEKEEWVKYIYTLPENEVLDSCEFSVVGVTDRGEIVLSMKYTCKPFYVFYFDPEKNTLQSVEIKGFGAIEAVENHCEVYAFANHVEDLSVNDAKLLKSA